MTFDLTDGEDKVLLGARQNDFGFFEWLDGTLVRNGYVFYFNCDPHAIEMISGY